MSRPRSWLLTLAMLVLAHPVMVVLVGGGALAALLFEQAGFLAVPGIAVLVGAIGGLITRVELPGVPVRPAEEPELTDLVRTTADEMGFKAPIAVRLVPVVDASLSPARLRGTRAYALSLGWPVVRHLSEPALKAIVAHELGHRTHLDSLSGRWLSLARGELVESREKAVRTPRALVAPLLRATRDSSWSRELAADTDSARLAGKAATRDALLHMDRLTAAYEVAMSSLEEVLDENGQYPTDWLESFDSALDDPSVQSRTATLARQVDELPALVEDTHPTTRMRIEALGLVTDKSAPGPPVRLRDPDALRTATNGLLAGPELEPLAVLEADLALLEPAEDEIRLRFLRGTGAPDLAAALSLTLTAVSDGTWRELARAVDPHFDDTPPGYEQFAERMVIGGCLTYALVTGLKAAGWQRGSRWMRSVLLDPSGQVVEVRTLVEAALDSGDVAPLRGLAAAAELSAAS